MLDLKGKSISLVGYGVSGRSMCRYLEKKGIPFLVRCEGKCDLPKGALGVFGRGYLNTCEDIVFRSPGVRPDKIRGGGTVLTEAAFGLDLLKSFKVGVTGSDGKTTTSTLIYRMLACGGKNAFLGGNIGYPIIDFVGKAAPGDYLVAELSSFQLMDASPLLDVAAVTNISENHLDWHKDMDEYICAKKNIIKNAKRSVLNYDDPVVREQRNGAVTYFSLENREHLVKNDEHFVHIVNGQVCYDRDVLFPVCDVGLRGAFNLQNVLCAIGCTYEIVGRDACYQVAREFCGVGGRQEIVGEWQGVTYINSAIDTTPTRTKNTLSAYPSEKTIAILGGYDKNLSYDSLRDVLSSTKAVVLCGENREKIMKAIGRHVINVNTIGEAVEVAYKLADEGDFVILTPASASFDMFKSYRQKGEAFENAVKVKQVKGCKGDKNGEN